MSLSFDQIIKSIEQLPATEQERICQWLKEKETSNGEADGGQWVALDGDRLIASGPTAKEVYFKAKAEGVDIPFVELVINGGPVPSTGGLS